MRFHHSLDALHLADSWLTIGTFDGVHRGHQAILRSLADGAHTAGVPAVVLTFDPHPAAVLRPQVRIPLLTSVEERAELLGTLGVDVVVAHPFDHSVAQLSAETFLKQIKTHTGFTRFLVGYDFAMGRGRDGDIPKLEALGTALGYRLQVFHPVGEGDAVVSSSRIRRTLEEGHVSLAAQFLGRPYAVTGTVVPGAQRGRSIGIPTANIAVPRGRAVPAAGVYACRVLVDGQVYGAATNIGVRPTFEPEDAELTVEAHLLDFDRDIYGKTVRVTFVERLRGEQKFSGVEALVAQIRADIARAREVLHAPVS